MIRTIKITKLKQIKGPKFKLVLGGYMHFCISSFISPDQIFNITFHEKTPGGGLLYGTDGDARRKF